MGANILKGLMILLMIAFMLVVEQGEGKEREINESKESGNFTGNATVRKEVKFRKGVSRKKVRGNETMEKLKEIQESVFPLSPEEVRKVRRQGESVKKAMEEERDRSGKVDVIYYDFYYVPKIKAAVNYATTVCFWGEIKEDDEAVVGSENFQVVVIKERKCVTIYPLKEFKETNLTVFIKDTPINFLVREVYDYKDVDVYVRFEMKPEISEHDLLKGIATDKLSEEHRRFLRELRELSSEERANGVYKKYIYEGRNKYLVYVVSASKVSELFSGLRSICMKKGFLSFQDDVCFVIEKKQVF